MHGEIASTPADVAMEGAIPGPWRERIEAAGRAVWGAVWGKGRGVAAILVVLFVAIRVADPAPIEVLRHKTFDLMQQMLPANTKPPLVMVAAIDEKSLAELGQWPWSRRTLAQLIVKLRRMGAIAIGFDVVFAEPDRTSPGYLAERTPGLGKKAVEELRKLPSNDSVFARVISRQPVVLGLFAEIGGAVGDGENKVLEKLAIATIGPNPRPKIRYIGELIENLPELGKSAKGIGVLIPEVDHDSIVRRVPAVYLAGHDAIVPALSIEMLRVATGQSGIAIKSNDAGPTSVVLQGVQIPVDRKGRMWLNALRKNESRYLSISDILADRVAPESIAGRMVLVGATAQGLQDIRSTSLEASVPGVEIHAHLIENAIRKTLLVRPQVAVAIELLATTLVGLLLILALGVVGARLTLVALLTVAGGLIVGALYLLRSELLLLDPSYPVAMAIVVYTYLVYASHVSEEKQRVFIEGAMGQYLSRDLVNKLADQPDLLKLGGEHKEMTFLFSDVRGFTSISEEFRDDPGGLVKLINSFLTPMTETIQARSGTVDKFMGDCIMAFWNAPLVDPEHARHACQAAFGMEAELAALNQKLVAEVAAAGREAKPLDIGIGINTGECIVGNMGSDQRFDYSVLGDSVNLASRLEGLSKTYGARIIIGEDTRAVVPEFAALELDLIAVKGRSEATRVFSLMGDKAMAESEAFRALAAAQTRMLTAYRARQWGRARQWIASCRELAPDLAMLYDLYDERIELHEANPPGEDWDGVSFAETK